MLASEAYDQIKTRVAWLYYVEGKTQDEIVSRTNLSRSRVLRMLATSRLDGTVQIRVTNTLAKCVELERSLEERWGLTRAIVIPEPQNPDQISAILGAELGAYVSHELTGNITVGLGWGKTLSSALPSIVPRQADRIRVLSLLGGLTRVSSVNPSEFAWRRRPSQCRIPVADSARLCAGLGDAGCPAQSSSHCGNLLVRPPPRHCHRVGGRAHPTFAVL